MKHLLMLLVLLFPFLAYGQQGNTVTLFGAGAPAGSCASVILRYIDTSSPDEYACDGSAWFLVAGGGGGAPTNATYVVVSLNGTLTAERVITAGTGIALADAGAGGTLTVSASTNLRAGALGITIDGGGAEITTGVKGYIEAVAACTISRATLLADQTGSIVIDVWKDTYANYPPVDADSITASAPPTISSSNKSQDTTLTGWTTTVSAGDVIGFNVDSVTTLERVHLILKCDKSS